MTRVVVFDFGGVMADEGFREGLKAIARANGIDEEQFFKRARDLIYETGYVTGKGTEHEYWQAVRKEFRITVSDEELRKPILERFIIRPEMFALVADLRAQGHAVALLTDQTDWLTILNQENGMRILEAFQYIFNSYELHMSKREPSMFRYVEQALHAAPDEILFVDDNPDNIRVAVSIGWKNCIIFRDYHSSIEELFHYLRGD